MSLKARIEAVIYAAEEPVTLAQLATLFRDEALASRAARLAPAADPQESVEAGTEAGLTDTIVDELLPPEPGVEAQPVAEAQPGVEAQPAPASEPGEPSAPEDDREGQREAQSADRAGPAQPLATDDEKRAARGLDREVRTEIRALIDELIADYSAADSGLEIREIAGGFRFATRAEYHDAVRAFVKSLKPPMKLSLQALETLAVIAYKQPVTAPEIGDIRGVDSGGVLGSLVARKLITTAGRKQVIGRPILYKTTKEFLLRFGLKDLNELPSIEEFEKMAGELSEPEEAGEDLPFAQNEIAAVEDNAEESAEASADSLSASSADPTGASPPAQDPQPEEPPPPAGENSPPDAEGSSPSAQDLAPTSEHDAAGPGSGDPMPPPEDDGSIATSEEPQS